MAYSPLVVHGVAVLCFPPTDTVFGGVARRLMEASRKPNPAALERALRQIYPRAVVREQDELASFTGPAWYVYRDGRYSPFTPDSAWWDLPTTARIVVGNDGRYLDANEPALAMLNVDLEALRSANAGDFTVPEFGAMVPWIMQLLRDTGELHSTSMLRPRGKADQPVEFHFVRDGDGPGRHVSTMRAVPIEAIASPRPAASTVPNAVEHVITIPASDRAFRTHVERIRAESSPRKAEDLERRLRRLFPRAVVRERELSGEPPSWYVYRDGGWRPPEGGPWWEQPGLPRIVVSRDGWITEANETARGLLAIDRRDMSARHFTDFVAPGTLEDSLGLFEIVNQGHELTATVLLRPTSGDLVAVDLRATREDDAIVSVLRLADDVEVPRTPGSTDRPEEVVSLPEGDWAFRGYVQLAMSRMSEPTPDGLALRLRRLYPHARITANGARWVAEREVPGGAGSGAAAWWEDPALPWVRYDAQALILEANEAAKSLLGRDLVGHHWQEFVTPGSTEQVSAMLAILADVGRAESAFRMPRADGSLIEFDSYTEVQGDTFTTVMRPRNGPETSDG